MLLMKRKQSAKAHREHVPYETSKSQIKTQGHLRSKRQRHRSSQVTGRQREGVFVLFENSSWPHICNPSIEEGRQIWSQCGLHSKFKAMQYILARICLKNIKPNREKNNKTVQFRRELTIIYNLLILPKRDKADDNLLEKRR